MLESPLKGVSMSEQKKSHHVYQIPVSPPIAIGTCLKCGTHKAFVNVQPYDDDYREFVKAAKELNSEFPPRKRCRRIH
jgi:hypothetical protein